MVNQQFFDHLSLLRERYYRKPEYNLFSVLRSDSDEVRLHSRFIADLLNPLGSHHFGDRFLNAFLAQLGVELQGKVSVDVEYKYIDILVRSSNTAIVIENKIYADDQDRQLERYHQCMTSEGYREIQLCYLTLGGNSPRDESLGELPQEDVQLLSYQSDIYLWISRCIELAAKDAPLREALIQYQSLINKLTNRIDNMPHIEQIKALLLQGDNLSSISELNQAHEEILVDAQLAMWNNLSQKMESTFGSLSPCSIGQSDVAREKVRGYVQRRRGNGSLFLMVALPAHDGCHLLVELEDKLFFGVYCESEEHELLNREFPYLKDQYFPMWAHPQQDINFRALSSADVKLLLDSDRLNDFTQGIVDELNKMQVLIK